ncbi:MAG: SurA N-terminal domain-containing protein [Desulfobacterales bacterium]|nr:SurA N-terminal domain-containing protein [Desulfobacterales bacterium]
MLNLMRKNAGAWIIKVLLGAIVVVFVFWGVGSFRSQRSGRIALVNGETITIEAYRETYNNLIEQYRQRFGNNLNEEMIKMLQIKKQAVNQLIDQKLLIQEAKSLSFRVSNDELVEAIRNFDAFQSNGNFNQRLYEMVLNRNRLTPEEFEILQKESMLINKLRSLVTGSIKVSDAEAEEWYNWNNLSVNIDFVLFEPDRYKDIELSADEMKIFYDNHKASYKIEPEIKVRYLRFEPEKYKPSVTLTDAEIKEYYETNQKEFQKNKTVEARHILLKTDSNASVENIEKGKTKALDILKMAKEGKDFAELAKKYSECPSKDRGGYLGAFEKEAMVQPFADKAFSMNVGEISEPVRTQFGWHIIKVEKINPEKIISLTEAALGIQKKLTDEKAKNLAYEEAEIVNEVSFEGDDLLKSAKERKLNIFTTDFFGKSGPSKEIKNRGKFATEAFNLSLFEISDILDLGDGYYILQPIEMHPERIPEFEEIQEKLKVDLTKDKRNEKAKKDAVDFLAELKNGKSMDMESKKLKLNLNTTGFFKRNDSIPHIGSEREIAQAAFKLSDKNQLPEDIIQGKKGNYVIRFKERKEPGPQGFKLEKKKIKEQLLQQKRFRAFEQWLVHLRNNSKISIEKDFLE